MVVEKREPSLRGGPVRTAQVLGHPKAARPPPLTGGLPVLSGVHGSVVASRVWWKIAGATFRSLSMITVR